MGVWLARTGFAFAVLTGCVVLALGLGLAGVEEEGTAVLGLPAQERFCAVGGGGLALAVFAALSLWSRPTLRRARWAVALSAALVALAALVYLKGQ